MSDLRPPRPPASELEAPSPGGERLAAALLRVAGLASVLTTAGLVAVLLAESLPFLRAVPLARLVTDTAWTPLFETKQFGLWPLIGGTALTTAIAIAVALPLGLTAAVYLSEFAAPPARRALKPLLELLAAVPTVVYGLFALTLVTPALQRAIPGLAGFNALSPGLVMGLMILPIVASVSEDALFAVPASLREAGLALGASRLSTALRVVLPNAASGIAAAVLLGLARAIGETMIVAIAAGQQPRLTLDPREPVETLTSFIAQVALGDTPAGSFEFHTLYAVGLVLFGVTLVFNHLSFRLRRRLLGSGDPP